MHHRWICDQGTKALRREVDPRDDDDADFGEDLFHDIHAGRFLAPALVPIAIHAPTGGSQLMDDLRAHDRFAAPAVQPAVADTPEPCGSRDDTPTPRVAVRSRLITAAVRKPLRRLALDHIRAPRGVHADRFPCRIRGPPPGN